MYIYGGSAIKILLKETCALIAGIFLLANNDSIPPFLERVIMATIILPERSCDDV
jgi:hypothetical protein